MARSKTAPRGPDAATPGGAYFLSLTVENIRCFGPEQTLDLSDGHGGYAPWTIILGENGLGKTTLLSCLACIARSGEANYSWIWFDWWRRFKRNQHPLSHALVTLYEAESGREFSVEAAKSSFTTAGSVKDMISMHYGAGRRMPRRTGLADDHRPIVSLDDYDWLRDPEDWFLTADYNAHLRRAEGTRFSTFAERVRAALVEFLPDVAEIRIHAADEPGGAPRVEAKTPDGWISLRQLGFGYQSQIAWLVDLASRMFERYPDSPNPLAEPAVVLVDEIDLHMHPRWQRQIIEFLARRFPRTQFIVTAHSPLVVQAAADANIVLLRREGDHVVIDNDPEVLRNLRVDQILTSELFGLESARPPQVEEPLKERRAILAKSRLTARDRKRLGELEAQIGDLPAGESAEDRRAMELIRKAAAKLSGEA